MATPAGNRRGYLLLLEEVDEDGAGEELLAGALDTAVLLLESLLDDDFVSLLVLELAPDADSDALDDFSALDAVPEDEPSLGDFSVVGLAAGLAPDFE